MLLHSRVLPMDEYSLPVWLVHTWAWVMSAGYFSCEQLPLPCSLDRK